MARSLRPTLRLLAPLVLLAPACAAETDSAPAEPTAALRPEVVFRTGGPAPNLLWVEGESADRSTAVRHGWYNNVRKDELSGDAWLSHYAERTAEAEYAVEVPENGRYHFWLRANPVAGPRMDYRLDGGEWRPVDFSDPKQRLNIASDGKPDMRFVAWLPQGALDLEAGEHTLTFRFVSKNKHHGAIDAFVLSKDPFRPNHALRPGAKSGKADPGKWAFEPAPDPLEDGALLDLSYLNETPAGKHGFIGLAEDGESFVDGRGRPVRFWSGTTYVFRDGATVDEIARWGRFYAKRGINMVRHHASLVPPAGEDFHSANEATLDDTWRLVAGMKQAGIYLTLSPYWGSHTDYRRDWPVPDPDHANMAGLLFFDPATQAAYKSWLRELFTRPNPYTGIPLRDEPALAIFQIQNEDSLLFWTAQRIQGEARALLRRQYADWLAGKYGGLNAARKAWDGDAHKNDDFAAGQAGLYTVWHLTRDHANAGRRARLVDQLEFLARTMHDFNAMIADYLRDELGVPQLINAGNWRTADDVKLLDAERWAYTANEVMGVNKYYGVVHQGPKSGYAILKGDRYVPRSALKHPRSLPTNVKQPAGHPMIIPESQWVPPNRYQSEGPLAVAAYQSLTGLDSFYWFTIGRGFEAPFGKWQTGSPVQMGMFPAAALIFRNGYLAEGEAVVHEHRALDDIWKRGSSILVEDPGFDPNRDTGDLPRQSGVRSGVDPLAFLAGPVKVTYGGDPAETRVADLDALIDAERGRVRGVTGEILLDHRRGILYIDAPKTKGAAGFLAETGPFTLGGVEFDVRNHYAAVYVVSLDGADLPDSANILVQATTTARPYGYAEKPVAIVADKQTLEGFEITSLGSSPWNLETNDVELSIANDRIRHAYVLDANGYPVREIPLEGKDGKRTLRFPEDALYVILR
ncbi:MAG: hypothetical protein GVY35_02840 [Bacteroidetes bacterium]|jgi:hypothetical protein|nr:hypothetical protein [Bacteroidota bacterium]